MSTYDVDIYVDICDLSILAVLIRVLCAGVVRTSRLARIAAAVCGWFFSKSINLYLYMYI